MENDDFIPPVLDESVVDVSAMASNAIEFVVRGKNLLNLNHVYLISINQYTSTCALFFFRAGNAKTETSEIAKNTRFFCQ